MPAFLHWLHVYFDDDSCMEVTALKGSCGDVQYFADRIIARVASDMTTRPVHTKGEIIIGGCHPGAAVPTASQRQTPPRPLPKPKPPTDLADIAKRIADLKRKIDALKVRT